MILCIALMGCTVGLKATNFDTIIQKFHTIQIFHRNKLLMTDINDGDMLFVV